MDKDFEGLDLGDDDMIRLLKSLEQADRGEFVDHETVKAKYAEWLTRSTEPNA